MKKMLLLATALTVSTPLLFAQPKKGDWLLGAKIYPPAIKTGYFISNRSVVGVDLSGNFAYNPQNKNLGFHLDAEATFRHYFASKTGLQPGRFYWFGDVSAGYQLQYGYNYFVSTGGFTGHFKAGVAPGLAYFINERISVDAALRANMFGNFAQNWSQFTASPEFGLQIYLRGRRRSVIPK